MKPERPVVTVGAPDDRGLRRVCAGGKRLGAVRSRSELRRLLNRSGHRDIDLTDATAIAWHGGDAGTWPDRPLRRRVTTALIVLGLLASAALLAWVGAPDMTHALTFAARATGLGFVVLGGYCVIAAAAAYDYFGKRRVRYSGLVALTGAVVTAVCTGLLVALWCQEMEYVPATLLFMPLFCWSLWATWTLCSGRPWKGLPHPKSFAVGVTATAVVAASNLVYSAGYQPYASPLQHVSSVAFGKPVLSADGGVVDVPLVIRVKNSGGFPFYLLGDQYTVKGRDANLNPDGAGVTPEEIREKMADEGAEAGDTDVFSGRGEKFLLSTGPVIPPGSWLEPGEEHVERKLVRVPTDMPYDVLEASFEVGVLRKDRAKVDQSYALRRLSTDEKAANYFECSDNCQNYVLHHGRVRHNNNIVNVTRRPRYVSSWRIVHIGGTGHIETRFDAIVTPLGAKEELVMAEDEKEQYGVFFLEPGTTAVSFAGLRRAAEAVPTTP